MGAPCSCPVRVLPPTPDTESVTSVTSSTPSAQGAAQRRQQFVKARRSGNRVAPLSSPSRTFASESRTHNGVSTIFVGLNNHRSVDSVPSRGSPAGPPYVQEVEQNRATVARGKKLVKQFLVESRSWDQSKNTHTPELSGGPPSSDYRGQPFSLTGGKTSGKNAKFVDRKNQPIGLGTNLSDNPGSMIDLCTNLDQVKGLVIQYNSRDQRSKQTGLQRQSNVKSSGSDTPSPKFNFNSWKSFIKPEQLENISLKTRISHAGNEGTNFQKNAKRLGQNRRSSTSGKDILLAGSPQSYPPKNLLPKETVQNEQMSVLPLIAAPQNLPVAEGPTEPLKREYSDSTASSSDQINPILTKSLSNKFSVTPNSFISDISAPNSPDTTTVDQQHSQQSSSISTVFSNSNPTNFQDSYDDGNNNNKPTKKRRHSYSSSCGSDDHLSDRHLQLDSCQAVDCITRHSAAPARPPPPRPTSRSLSTNSLCTTLVPSYDFACSEPIDRSVISRKLASPSPPPPLLHNSKSEVLLRPIDDDQQSYLQRSKTLPLHAPRYRFRDPATEFLRTIQDPASQRLTWYKPPLSVLVVKKVRDAMVIPPFLELVTWLTQEKRMVVFVEASVLNDRLVTGHAKFPAVKDKLMSFRETHDDLTDKIDFIICLGGDGTLLYASSLFQQSVPPVMAFHLGSLGFLTPFKFNNYQEQVTNVLEGHAALTLRSRLRCIILRRGQEKQLPPSHHPPLPSTYSQTASTPDDKTTSPTSNSSGGGGGGLKAPTNLLVLNEVVIDRGPSPYLSNLDLYLDGKRITSVQGDGLIVSTPTGSTAYAVAAGASMIHPSVPAIMVTPICPHSLSFRPIVVPAGVELKITVSKDSRNTAWVSFDGRMRQELKHDDSLRVTTSIYPVPSICAEDQIADWFASLDECLRWNDRKRQRHLDDVVEDDINNSEPSSPNTLPTTPTTIEKEAAGGLQRVLEKGETVEEEEEEELEPEA